MKKFGNLVYLLIRKLEGEHAFVRASTAYYFTDQIAVDVMAQRRRVDQVGPVCVASVWTVTDAALLLEDELSCRCNRTQLVLRLAVVGVLREQPGAASREVSSRMMAFCCINARPLRQQALDFSRSCLPRHSSRQHWLNCR